MPIKTNTRLLRIAREIIMGNAKNALPYHHGPKPEYCADIRPVPLPRSTPEAEGVNSADLQQLLVQASRMPNTSPHSFMVLRHGKVLAEAYFAPYRKEVWHVLHSTCKTFTGVAVGFAISEGLFKLDDPVAPHFPAKVPVLLSKRQRAITVRHLLTMSSGITLNEVSELVEPDWLRGIFAGEPAFMPGSQFMYNSMNSYLLAALVRKTSGQSLVDYLTPRLFQPLEFGPVGWEKSSAGVEKGGWGMYLTTEDMAKFGQLFLQKGKWQVKGEWRQVVPAGWIKKSTGTQIAAGANSHYGLHLWANPNGNFTMNGMFGQYIAAFPQKDMLVVMTAGNPNVSPESNMFQTIQDFVEALPVAEQALPPNPAAQKSLRTSISALQKSRSLTLCKPQRLSAAKKAAQQAEIDLFCGTTWQFERNNASILPVVIQCMDNNFCSGIKALQLQQSGDGLLLFWEEDEGTLCIPLGLHKPKERVLTIGNEKFLLAAEAALRFNEDDQPVLKIQLSFLEHSSTRSIKLLQQNGQLQLRMDETPQLSIAMETAIAQNAATTKGDEKDPLARLLKNNHYLHFRIGQLCTPEVWGTPLPMP